MGAAGRFAERGCYNSSPRETMSNLTKVVMQMRQERDAARKRVEQLDQALAALAVWMDFGLGAEIRGSSEQSAGPCLPRLERESQRRSALDGQSGRRPGEVNNPPLRY